MSQKIQKKVLVLVDIQNDFLPTGDLLVPFENEVFVHGLLQVLCPDHCIQHTVCGLETDFFVQFTER